MSTRRYLADKLIQLIEGQNDGFFGSAVAKTVTALPKMLCAFKAHEFFAAHPRPEAWHRDRINNFTLPPEGAIWMEDEASGMMIMNLHPDGEKGPDTPRVVVEIVPANADPEAFGRNRSKVPNAKTIKKLAGGHYYIVNGLLQHFSHMGEDRAKLAFQPRDVFHFGHGKLKERWNAEREGFPPEVKNLCRCTHENIIPVLRTLMHLEDGDITAEREGEFFALHPRGLPKEAPADVSAEEPITSCFIRTITKPPGHDFASLDRIGEVPEAELFERMPLNITNIDGIFSQLIAAWWHGRDHRIHRVKQETAEYLRTVNLSFIPESPPPSWKGNVIVIDGRGHDLIPEVSQIAMLYWPFNGKPNYTAVLNYPPLGNLIYTFGADTGKLNVRLMEDNEILTEEDLSDLSVSGDAEALADEIVGLVFRAIKFALAFSYYLEFPDIAHSERSMGQPRRNAKGKALKKKGRKVPLWSYVDLTVKQTAREAVTARGPLETENKILMPTVVGPQVRLYQKTGKVVYVAPHDSHRWNLKEKIGKKVTV